MVQVENLRAIEGGKDVQIEYLGCLIWHTVSDVLKIPSEDLKNALEELGLEKFMPRKINPRDAFRRVTKSLETRRVPYGKDSYANLLIREVKQTEGEVIRQVVREVVDSENKRLDYLPVMQLEMGQDNRLVMNSLVEDLTPTEYATIEKLPQMLEEAQDRYDGTHIRYMLYIMLQHCNPVSVRPNGGVLFIPQKHSGLAESIKKLAKKLDRYEGNVRVWSVPVIDATEHREMVEESLEEQVINGSISLINEMKKIIENPNNRITAKSAQSYAERIRKMKDAVIEYEDMLETQATKARENLELARLQAAKLLELTELDAG